MKRRYCFCGSAWMRVLDCSLHALRRNNLLASCSCGIRGSPRCVFSIVFYTYLGKVRFTNCFCGIAQLYVLHCVLHALNQCQANELLLLAHSRCMFCIVLYTYWGNLRLSNCFCGSAQLYVCNVVSHKLKQYLALWDWPDACFVLCFACIEPSISLTNCYCGTAHNRPDASVV